MRRRHVPGALLALGVSSLLAAAPVDAMPVPTANVVTATPSLPPSAATAVPADAVAVLRDDTGAPFVSVSRAQFERFRSAQAGDEDGGGVDAGDAALRQLLNLHWLRGEMQRLRIVLTERRIDRARNELVLGTFRGWDAYRRYLRKTGYTRADVRLNLVVQLGQQAILREISRGLGPGSADDLQAQSDAVDAFRARFLAAWWKRTTCAADVAAAPVCSAPPAA